MSLRTPIGRVRLTGIIEGLSFVILLLIAMPLKYWADVHEAVTIIGSLHGALFVIYLLAIAQAFFSKRLSFRMSAVSVIASFIPFGPFVLDRKLRSLD